MKTEGHCSFSMNLFWNRVFHKYLWSCFSFLSRHKTILCAIWVAQNSHWNYHSYACLHLLLLQLHLQTCMRYVLSPCCQGMHTFLVLANPHSLQWGLVSMVVLGQRLKLMALEIFSSLNDPMIPSIFMIVSLVLLSLRVFWDMHFMCLRGILVKFRHQDWWKVHQ